MTIEKMGRYLVVGSDDGRWDVGDYSECNPIEMSVLAEPGCDDLEKLITIADSDIFTHPELSSTFQKSYREIMRGDCPGWELHAFEVFVGGICLYYCNRETRESGFLWIKGAENLALSFATAKTKLGFSPTYEVHIEHRNGQHCSTVIAEDLGFERYTRELKLLDPNKVNDSLFHEGNQYFRTTKYTGI